MKKIIAAVAFLCSLVSFCADGWVKQLFEHIANQETILYHADQYQQAASSLVQAAESDPNFVTRLFKELMSYPTLLVSNKQEDPSVTGQLFPGASVHEVSQGQEQNLVQAAVHFIYRQQGYCVLLTNLGSQTSLITDFLEHEKISRICVLPVDEILAACNHETTHNIDVEKIYRLMKRKIHVVCTAAIIPIKADERKMQYIRSLSAINQFGYRPYIIESCVQGRTFLDDWAKQVLYTQTNDSRLQNKGVNEFTSMLHAFNYWEFNDDDIIVKLTGRYVLRSDAFIRFLEDADDVDCAAKFVTVSMGDNSIDAVLTGCFAMRFNLFKEMLESFDYEKFEREMICVEHAVGPHLNAITEAGVKVVRREKLDVEANMFYSHGSSEISYW